MKTLARILGTGTLILALAGCIEETASQLPGDALVPGTNYNATGSLPCSDREGRNLYDCEFGVIRRGGGDATVVVTLPSGFQRRIEFIEGRPVASNSSGGITSRRIGDVTLVFIGAVERHRIVDAIVFGG